MNIDDWFRSIREKYADDMQCGKGCTACCHGLFDISLADAAEAAAAFQRLPASLQNEVSSRATAIQSLIREAAPNLPAPLLLAEDDSRIDAIVDAANSPACPFLGGAGECLIYDRRPMPCRLEGVPMVDTHDGLFGDWCELNFTQGVPDAAMTDLQQDYDSIDEREERSSAIVARKAALGDARMVTFLSSVVAEYQTFWKRFLR
jgi:Fe-S-cluster containining protein